MTSLPIRVYSIHIAVNKGGTTRPRSLLGNGAFLCFLIEEEEEMAKEKKLVAEITAMEEDFAQWYTDVVKKADLVDYATVRGSMIIRPYGYAIWENIQKALEKQGMKTYISRFSFRRVFFRKKKIILKDLPQK
jgi:prolyl-tRNA synthetase